MRLIGTFPALTAGFALALTASAQTNTPTLQEIVVTPAREAVTALETPATVHVIDHNTAVQERGVRTTPDVFDGLPSVMVQKTSYGQGSPFLRGFTGFRTLALIDGIRLNNSAFRDGPNQYWNTIDPFSVERYELVLGPASVLYGSDAIGGTAQAFTIAPPEQPGWERTLFLRAASADESLAGRAQVRGRTEEGTGFAGGFSLKTYGDVRGGDEVGEQKHTGYDEYDVDAKLDHRVGANGRLTLAHQSVRQDDAWRAHRTIYGIDWEGLKHGDDKVHTFDQARDLTYARYDATELPGFADEIAFTLSRHAQGEDLYRVRADDRRDEQGFDVETWGAAVQFASRKTPVGDLVYGAEYYRDDVDSYSRKYKAGGAFDKADAQGPVADDATYETLGAYVQDTIEVTGGGLQLVPGARYTHVAVDANKVKDPVASSVYGIENDWDAVVGSLRAIQPLGTDRRQSVFAGVGQGFRAPNLSDLSRFDIARSGEIETPAPDLDPEQFVSFEIGYKLDGEVFQTQLSAYHTLIDDMIVRTPTGREIDGNKEVTKLNSGEGFLQGVELVQHVKLDRDWSAWLMASAMDGEVDAYATSEAEQASQYTSRIMPVTGQAGVRWQREGSALWVEFLGDAADKADRLSADDARDTQRIPPGGTPGYVVLTARGGTTLADGLDLTVALENLLDEDYRIHGSGVNEPGRNFVVTAGYTF